MFKKFAIAAAAIGALSMAAPASATNWGGHKPKPKPPVSSTSGGTQVPEPGMLGICGASLIVLGAANARRRRRKG